jgi:hypothetical protein
MKTSSLLFGLLYASVVASVEVPEGMGRCMITAYQLQMSCTEDKTCVLECRHGPQDRWGDLVHTKCPDGCIVDNGLARCSADCTACDAMYGTCMKVCATKISLRTLLTYPSRSVGHPPTATRSAALRSASKAIPNAAIPETARISAQLMSASLARTSTIHA